MVLRVGYIREHFASPLLQFAGADEGRSFQLVECPGGTGQIIKAFKDDEIDIGIALTDALIAGIANGNKDYLLIGQYVTTPLNWAVVVGHNSAYQSIADLRGTTMGISRIGSGSQTMAEVMAMQQGEYILELTPGYSNLGYEGWYTDEENTQVEKINVKVNNNIDGLIASVNDGSTSAFMWEWFTTKPYADKGLVRFIGSVPTPWPSWMIAASSSSSRAPADKVRAFLASLSEHVRNFSAGLHKTMPVGVDIMDKPVNSGEADEKDEAEERNMQYIVRSFGYLEKDVKEWMDTVGYPEDVALVDLAVVVKTLDGLEMAGVVKRPTQGFEPKTFVQGEIARFE